MFTPFPTGNPERCQGTTEEHNNIVVKFTDLTQSAQAHTQQTIRLHNCTCIAPPPHLVYTGESEEEELDVGTCVGGKDHTVKYLQQERA